MDIRLKEHFEFAAAKTLRAVDALPTRSNQHEIGGLVEAGLGRALGPLAEQKATHLQCKMFRLTDSEETPICVDTQVTWYNTRAANEKRGPEYRLYYRDNAVTECLNEGDFMLVALRPNKDLVICFCPQGSPVEWQLRDLFGLNKTGDSKFHSSELNSRTLLVTVQMCLEEMGIIFAQEGDEDELLLEQLLDISPNGFPSSRVFSSLARERVARSSFDNSDQVLMEWLAQEEMLFRVLERHIVRKRLKEGFGLNFDDVDEFISYSLSVHNRRKSRVGHAFENHLEVAFVENGLHYEKGSKFNVTENNSKPDFLFPHFRAYHDQSYPVNSLFMLAAKTTCKDRWRQVLAEAERLKEKYLVTLQPGVSVNQIQEMKYHNLQLVVPEPLINVYPPEVRGDLITLQSFINHVRRTQF
ncbi:restriction endonuclease [Lelliottia aquatilis]|uniref:type II restriction endonuclease n=1 Tax=Lelliottia aquatilis TaxID=2080838 RepID=UPI000CDEFB46|nr:type II restriction endonuclease [Lelliottia aquatilis]POZ17036.1 restriction endonuclease [Lelliottia aquatilis]